MTRDEKVREARRLRALGWSAPEIGRELGVSDSTVRNWCLGGDCPECGRPVEGSNAVKSRYCSPCNNALSRYWTAENIIKAIHEWAQVHGRPPQSNDWIHGDPNGRWPNRGNVYRSSSTNQGSPFATWNDAIRAAGFTPTDRGKHQRVGTVQLGKASMPVLQTLRHSPKPLRPVDIERRTSISRGGVWSALNVLRRRGLAQRVSYGQYVAAP